MKTLIIAAAMTLIGATTTFANNINHHPHTPNRVEVKNRIITHREYKDAKHCHCRTCKDIVRIYEMQERERQMHRNCHNAHCNHHAHAVPAPQSKHRNGRR